jgi:hypothetical protein
MDCFNTSQSSSSQDGYTQDGFNSLDEYESDDEGYTEHDGSHDLWVHRFSHTLRYKDRLWLVSIDTPSTLVTRHAHIGQQLDGTRHKASQMTVFLVNDRSIGSVSVDSQCHCARLREPVVVYEWFDSDVSGRQRIEVISDVVGLTKL